MSYSIGTANRFAAFAAKQPPHEPKKTSTEAGPSKSEEKAKALEAKKKQQAKNKGDNDKRGGNRERGNRGRGRGRGGVAASGRGRGRKMDRQSGTGRRPNEEKKGGQGVGNWGSVKDEIEIGIAEVAEENEATDAPVVAEEPVEPTVREITLEEYEKQRAERAATLELTTNKRVVEVDDDLKAKFVVLEKKSKEVLPKSNKKSKKKTQGNKKTVLPVSFSMEAPRSDRGRGGRGGNRGNRGGNRGKGRKERGPKIDPSSGEDFPSL
mmetsp:Transcript_32839/g.50940  ORF Transcript_32839/g.50940 Transcript_32839/m.50940 type:complete len:266 (+) Transcript_32839:63-860(+)|eukprot:CAMPEP_0117028558 /NCGR_PEP_ID=MMETSP0472-20121206/20754_1 /TAXON_ID=693140 ORGANISM="Tiarina fusus, Strain LIS" /NCGR_SAMPLE_ID=MMETSP0472 /ASSEMBLY_ACC=CAM_ASM_000603 /LENGTH=265 /DNA_ID=CAMNT_0004736079 /DNA_START=63 /DNA_END=860 /DNA_ORIENTATION=-